MVEKLIIEIKQQMINLLNNMQMEELHKVLLKKLQGLAFVDQANNKNLENEEVDYCNIFICAKRVEGCSEKSLKYYKSVIENILNCYRKNFLRIRELKKFLEGLQIKMSILETENPLIINMNFCGK